MKKFTKIMLILAGVFASIGVICMVVAFAMGLTTTHLWGMVKNGQFSFDMSDIQISGSGNSTTEMKVYEVCDKMEIEFGAGVLEISYDDVEEIQVNYSNMPNLKIGTEHGVLSVRDESKIGININNGENRKLEIVIPKDTYFEEVDIEIGASKATISDLSAKSFELQVGAGQAIVKNLSTQELDVDTGVGEVDIEIAGTELDYNYDVDCGIGKVVIGSYSWEGIGAKQLVDNGAECHMNIVCGVGEVCIHFTSDAEMFEEL